MILSKVSWTLSAATLVVVGTSLNPSTFAHASVHTMRTTQIVLNGKTFSSPKAFTYLNTTYMPIYYVQNLLRQLGIENTWSGSTWTLKTQDQNFNLNLVAKTGNVNIVINKTTVVQKLTSVVDIDPYSGHPTTFIPIWYMQEVLRALGLQNDWNGSHWTMTANDTAYSKSGTNLGSFATLEDAEYKLIDYTGGMVKDASGQVVYSQADFTNVDLRFSAPSNVNPDSINAYFVDHKSPLAGLGQSFMAAQNMYGVNANYLLSHAIEESGWGTSQIATGKNDIFGYGAFDANQGSTAGVFPSEDYAIRFQGWEVRNNYLNPDSSHYHLSPTLTGMSYNYATDPNWATNIGILMNQFAIDEKDTVSSYVQYPSTQSVATPSSTDEPVFYTNGYQGTVLENSNYTGLPIYSDMSTGEQQMFTRTLQSGSSGVDVLALQTALNQQMGAGLTTDGNFGTKTTTAVQAFQTQHGLPVTGVCDFDMWTNALHLGSTTGAQLTNGTVVNIDQMKQGLAGGDVVEWYHIAGQGWVDANFINLSNVYRLTVSDPTTMALTTVKVYDASNTSSIITNLHAGDYVVSTSPTGAGGWVTIQFANQTTGISMTGVVSTSAVSLSKVGA